MNNIQALLIFVLLSGCASLSYHEPSQGPRARVRFTTNTSGITILRGYDDASCAQNETEWMRLRNGYLVNSTPKSLGMPLWQYHVNAAKEVYVATEKQTNGMFVVEEIEGPTLYQCGVPFNFTFADGQDYEVNFIWSLPNNCQVVVSQITLAAGEWASSRVATFDNRISDSNRECLTKFEKVRLY